MPHLRAGTMSCRSLAALLLFLSTVGGVAAEPLRIRYSVWVGYGPLFLAKEKGYFKAENVDVQLVKMEDPKESYQAMGAGRLDGVVSTVDTVIPHLRTGAEYQTSWRSTTPRAGTGSSRAGRSSPSGTSGGSAWPSRRARSRSSS